MVIDLSQPMRQTDFGELVGVSQQAISDLVNKGVLDHGQPAGAWLLAYCTRLREQAAGRLGDAPGGLDLAQERAALAREMRVGHALNNAIKCGQYASIELLAQVLAAASQTVAERFEHLPGMLRRTCPDLPIAAVEQVVTLIAAARNDWVRGTQELVVRDLLSDDDSAAMSVADEPSAG
jgi:phage terminase Nu1 subunit (DNA packaging protein)